jgi:hypothetical protein
VDSITRAFNQLERTFTAQIEALKRYRTGGEQKVTVQHVSVSEGGQAIVGNVTQTASDPVPESAAHAPPAPTHSKEPPIPIISEPERGTVPVERGQKAPPRRSRKNDDAIIHIIPRRCSRAGAAARRRAPASLANLRPSAGESGVEWMAVRRDRAPRPETKTH